MCGRYTSTTSAGDLADYFGVDEVVAPDLGRRYNVAPTDEVYGVATTTSGQRRLGTFRWGLVPSWADDPSVGSRMINARAETLLDKPAYRGLLARRRCILPADGFYEWQRVAGGKQAWYVRHRDGRPLALAGLWSSWRAHRSAPGGRPDKHRLVSAAVITTVPNHVLGRIHDRMPVVLPPEAWEPWLDVGDDDLGSLLELLVPAPAEMFELVPVGPAVGDVRNDGPELLEPTPTARLFPPTS